MSKLLSVLLLVVLPGHATLIIQIPTAEGMLVASDSRSVGEGVCDERDKLMPLQSKPPAVASATGWTMTIDEKSLAVGGSFCDALSKGERPYDLQAVVEKYFQDLPLDRESWNAFPPKLIDSLYVFKMKYARAAVGTFQPSNDLFTVVMAFWGSTGLVSANATMGVSPTRNPYLKHTEWREYSRWDLVHVEAYGEVSSYEKAIASGPLADELKLLQSKKINLVRAGEAFGFARRAIQAAAGASERQAIGGRAKAYMIGPRGLREMAVRNP